MNIWNKFKKHLGKVVVAGVLVTGLSFATTAVHADDPGQPANVTIICPESPNPQPDLDWVLGCVRSATATATPTN